jgi:hypothetical protein
MIIMDHPRSSECYHRNGAAQLHESERVPKNPFLQSLDVEDAAVIYYTIEWQLGMAMTNRRMDNIVTCNR